MNARRVAVVVSLLWRPLAKTVAFEVPLLVAVAAIVTFFVSLPLKAPMDGLFFQLRSSYSTMSTSDGSSEGSDGTQVDRLAGFPVAPVPAGGYRPDYTPLEVRLRLDVVPSLAAYQARVVGSNVTEVSGDGMGIWIDQDSALRMGVGMGDQVALLGAQLVDGMDSPLLTVTGILRPYASPDDMHASGLAVVARDALPAAFAAEALGTTDLVSVTRSHLVFDGSDPGAASRSSLAAGFVLELFSADWLPILGGLLGASLLLFLGAVARSAGHFLRRMRGVAALAVAVGATPREAATAALGPHLLITVAAVGIGAGAIALAVFPWLLRWSIQAVDLIPAVVVLGTVALAQAGFAGMRLSRQLREGTLITLLGGDS
jgi:hypothetical protein